MNKQALTKHNIYNKLTGFSDQDLHAISSFIDFMQHQKQPGGKKLLKLEGILHGYDIGLAELKQFKRHTWQHVDKEFADG